MFNLRKACLGKTKMCCVGRRGAVLKPTFSYLTAALPLD